MFLGFWVYIRFFGGGGWRFRSYSDSLWQTPQRKQRSGPRRSARSLGLGVPSLRDSSGGIASGLLRCTSSRCVWLRQTSLRSYPRINPSTQPSEGASTARSKAAAELALILCRSCRRLRSFDFNFVGAELAREGGLTADPFLRLYSIPVGAGLPAMTASQPTII
jgi:hypothetical protein